jgi:hypothetical protein
MKTDYCQFGNCKRAQKVIIAMTNLTTKETSTAKVCAKHSASVLDACERKNLFVDMTVIK